MCLLARIGKESKLNITREIEESRITILVQWTTIEGKDVQINYTQRGERLKETARGLPLGVSLLKIRRNIMN